MRLRVAECESNVAPTCLPFFLLLKVSLEMIENSIEVLIYSATSENTFLAVMEKILVYVGLSFVFSVIVLIKNAY